MAGSGNRTEMRHLLRSVFREQAREPLLTLGLLRQHWEAVVGPELAARTQPHRLEGGTLWIAAPDACWAYELQFFKPELLASVQAFLESRAISDVRFCAVPAEAAPPAAAGPGIGADGGRIPTAPPPRTGGRPGARPEGPGEPPETPEALARASAAIGDPALREVFRRSLAKQRRARALEHDKPRGE